MPVTHIVMFGFTDATTPEQAQACKDALLAMPAEIGCIKAIKVGEDLKLPSGQNHPAGKNRSLVGIVEFDSAEAYEEYAVHPAHLKVIAEYIKPIMEPGTRSAIQFES
mmetsp:Transcript_86326/g.239388  ORF Transcript_86326/g.239388 Transcript_86326/m.239388 type:complete len:108 (-) Transcript_86326:129-452(-)|eukprot:CAMPEP_0179120810 /NCGR_PEP_ID=MMETSP0796-20121207/56941_1 /TAXON_ID=73915 /ORGANISM="Pyrodinium bahamense, Strain pbaha01" /LENGTH=107 /DNA_ID=CAMNT_0020819371 /DNA_START=55 /DNA_END=378 /DNA_ORIENTATION=-